jgi:hypothetical protein
MTNRISSFLALLILTCAVLILGGCGPGMDTRPKIVGRVDHIQPRPVPQPVVRLSPVTPKFSRQPSGWVPNRSSERRWKAIVIHHTAMSKGSMATIDSYHRNNNGWDGVGYDFVIGNGKGSRDGQVEVTFRWRKQVAGAHCGGTPNNWANESAIGVCLIGDFTKTRPTYSQMVALKKLVRFLKDRYHIPVSRIYGHGTTPGYTRVSACPGPLFPMSSFKQSL